jgi:hypothetical protein
MDLIARPKEKGGIGIKDLDKMIKSLLVKWWWKLESREGLWQKLVRAKYMRDKPVASLESRQTDSPCWPELMKVRDIYLQNRKMKVRIGEYTSFWDDAWYSSLSLRTCFLELHEVCNQQKNNVSEGSNFRRWLDEN